MAADDPYMSVAEFKARIGKSGDGDDAAIERSLKAASRWIDRYCGRNFNRDGTAESPAVRYFTARYGDLLNAGDIVSLEEIALDSSGAGTYATILAADAYDLLPIAASDWGFPYTELRPVSLFPTYVRRGIRLTGIFGWPAVPEPIIEATGIQANRLWARSKAPFGIVGAPNDLGQLTAITTRDPDVVALINQYRVTIV